MDTDLRASLIASGAAAILSILVGAVSGVGFLAIVLRALAGGIVFGAIVYGAFALFRRFLPELFSSEAESGSPEPLVGGAVDIVLPGEGPEVTVGTGPDGFVARPAEGAGAMEAEAVGAEPRSAAPERAVRATAAAAVPAGTRRVPAFAAEEEEAEDVTPYLGESLIDSDGTEEAGAEELPLASQNQQAAPLSRPSDGLDDLDVLPDLESLSDGFNSSMGGGGMSTTHEVSEPDHRPREGGRRGDADPAMLAQAVRTLLKRDQER